MTKAEVWFHQTIQPELERVISKFPDFNSSHEGYAVILEELDELWSAIKSKDIGPYEMTTEAVQVAAMAMRFLVNLCDDFLPQTEEG